MDGIRGPQVPQGISSTCIFSTKSSTPVRKYSDITAEPMAQLMLRYLVYLEPKLGITIQMNCLGVQGKQHAPNMQLKENQGHFTRPHASFGIKEKVPGLQPSLFHLFSAQFSTAQK